MKKIGITGSLASGKTTASKILSKKIGPLFSADNVVKKMYKNPTFEKKIIQTLNIKKKTNLKIEVRKKVLKNKKNLKKLEKVIHPIVRKDMLRFIRKNKKRRFIFLEIPLLIESKLTKYFDVIIFIKSKKDIRLKRYLSNNKKNKKFFEFLNNKQIKDSKKMKYCDHIVVNNNSLSDLKKKLFNIIKLYE